QAKKTLAKKPGPGKEKADKIHIDRFLNDLVKNDTDPDSNISMNSSKPEESWHKEASDSLLHRPEGATLKGHNLSSENKLKKMRKL
ncbi:16317_t:CDS:2, partial [Gigaspora rosea]